MSSTLGDPSVLFEGDRQKYEEFILSRLECYDEEDTGNCPIEYAYDIIYELDNLDDEEIEALFRRCHAPVQEMISYTELAKKFLNHPRTKKPHGFSWVMNVRDSVHLARRLSSLSAYGDTHMHALAFACCPTRRKRSLA
eukprot:TRINITY_DN2343_c0_g1_i3.p2 TRINITY_DN2343_c0_g1~~TRINITY_DN2343_c0_g1_i3.p2  ORF type:complete len:139 (+),score=20.94 TRINITY_DN2343_c0_g1_i3:131-547(+)